MNLSEFTEIVSLMQSMLPPGAQRAAQHNVIAEPRTDNAPQFDDLALMMQRQVELLTTIANQLAPFAIIGEQIAKQAQAESATPAPAKRGRKPKEPNGADQPDAATVPPMPPADGPVQPGPSSASAGEDDLPDFLKRTGSVPPQQTPAPAPAAKAKGELTEDEVRAVLTSYMNKFGEEGMEKLSELLGEFNATMISTLKPEHWKACVNKAKRELLM